MAITNKPSVTTLQVGATAYFMSNNAPQSAKVIKTISEVTDLNDDNTAEETVLYFLEGFSEPFVSSKLFSSKTNLKNNLTTAADSLT